MKIKNILLCNNTLAMFAGSETYTYSIAVELKRRGYNVTAFSLNIGNIAQKMQEEGIEVVDNLDGRKDDFDLIIGNHFDTLNYVKAKVPNTRIINTVHGIIGGPETPVLYADHHVAVSEEVKMLLKERYGVESTIIRQGIDLERFKETRKREDKPRNILLSSSYYSQHSDVFKAIYEACATINATVHVIGKDFNWLWETEAVYNSADMVITLGRGCVEAMACNRPVICLGHWGKNQMLSADGLITKDNYKEIRKNNFSSRRFRKEWKTKDILQEIMKYDNKTDYRKIVEKEHDIKKIVDQYLALVK
jgi:hypothetical protein